MLIIIMTAWLLGVSLILIFFRGATKKEKQLEAKEIIKSIKGNTR